MDIAYARIMLLGTAGVGKTSLKRALMRENWNPKISSTIVSQVHSIRPVGREWQKLGHNENEPLKEVTKEDEVDEMSVLLAAVHQYDVSGIQKFHSKIAVTELFHDQVFLPEDESFHIPAAEKVAEFKEKHVNTVLSQAIAQANSKCIMRQNSELYPFVHIWDCGGQPIFLEILPAFLTSRTMFLLCFDASKGLHEKWKSVHNNQGEVKVEEEVNMTTLDLIVNWLSNIHIHLTKKDREGALLDYPRILCIGTHGDKLSDEEKMSIIDKIRLHCKGKPFEMLIEDFYIVDNTTAGNEETEDPNFAIIRRKIYDFTSEKLIVKTPISWVLFRKVIQMLDANIISLKEAHAIGEACKIPHKLVFKVLLFYHDLGVLLFYPHIRGLQDAVIINPRWFVQALGKVLTLQGREDYKLRLKWDLLREKGILVQSLYVAAWRDVPDIKPEALMKLLVYFRLAAKVKTDLYYDHDEKQYFLPLVLPSYAQKQPFAPKGYCQKATPIHLTFRTGFSPPGFFTRLITSIAKSSNCVIQFDKGVYRNRIYILFGSNPVDHVILTELPQAIQVEIFRYVPENSAIDNFDCVCQELHAFLSDVAKNVDYCLFGNGRNEGMKVFYNIRYVCAAESCNSTMGPHYLKQAKQQTCDMPLNCEKNDTYRVMLKEESLWFCYSIREKKATKHLSDQEILQISDHLSRDDLFKLAANFNMVANLRAIEEDVLKCKHIGFHLLYEWSRSKAGVRNELVTALRTTGHAQLAQMVEVSEYDTERFKQNLRAQSEIFSDHKRPKPFTDRCSTLSTLPSSSQPPTIQPLSFKTTLKNETDNEDLSEIILTPTTQLSYENSSLRRTPSGFTQSEDEMNYEIRRSCSPLNETFEAVKVTATDISDNDLLRCSLHIKKNLSKLAGRFDITNEQLAELRQQYDDQSSQAYQLLKKCLEVHPDTTRGGLKEILEILNFSKAAQQLEMNPGKSCLLM